MIKAREYDILEKFNAIFPQLQKVAEPVKIENNTLFLKVENSVWRSELNFKQKTMVEKINEYFNTEAVVKIKFVSK